MSIIIPVLNEADALPQLLDDLVRQKQLTFEVIVVDGGSADETVAAANCYFDEGKLVGQCLVSEKGRGRQLNAGARTARSEWLLFLHADSRLNDRLLLSNALAAMLAEINASQDESVAGRFQLKFDVSPDDRTFASYYYECKARLGRQGCIHGDQGLLIQSSLFRQVGPFREDLPVMEDTSLAETVGLHGRWLLLPGEVLTSWRRFQVEGWKARQTLNALMMNFRAIGWYEFFDKAPELYRQQQHAETLALKPFFTQIDKLLQAKSFRQRWQLWLATGCYVRSQAWQIGFMFDCHKAYRKGVLTPENKWVQWFDKWFDPVTDNVLGNVLTTILVRIWFTYRWIC